LLQCADDTDRECLLKHKTGVHVGHEAKWHIGSEIDENVDVAVRSGLVAGVRTVKIKSVDAKAAQVRFQRLQAEQDVIPVHM
jgi:hypothetical protein